MGSAYVTAAFEPDTLTLEDCLSRRAMSRSERLADVNALVLALSFAGQLSASLFDAALRAVSRRGKFMDSGVQGQACSPHVVTSRHNNKDMLPGVLVDGPEICVLWKPPRWTVSVGCEDDNSYENDDSDETEELVQGNRMQDWVMQHMQNRKITSDAAAQHGLLHRLDKETSGALLCAKTYLGYHVTLLQFVAGRVHKNYVCLCHGTLFPGSWNIDSPLRAVGDRGGRRSVLATTGGGKHSRTEVCQVAHITGVDGAPLSLVEIRLHTGRMHQIRAHLSGQGCPLVGDTLYGGGLRQWCPRVFLHACRLRLVTLGQHIDVQTELPDDLLRVLTMVQPATNTSRILLGRWIGHELA